MDEVRYMTTWEQRFFSHVFSAFAAAAVLLACLGAYGLVAYRGTQRTHEIGIRVALGAGRRDVERLLVGQGITLAAAGILVGFVLSLGVTRVLGSVLYGTSAHSGLYIATAAILLLVPILLASYIPARRAARVGPMAALRQD